MGYEYEWDSKENNKLHDTDFSFATGSAQERLLDYQLIATLTDNIEHSLPEAYRPAFFLTSSLKFQHFYNCLINK